MESKSGLKLLGFFNKSSVDLRKRLRLYLLSLVVVIFAVVVAFSVLFDVFSYDKPTATTLRAQNERFKHKLESFFRGTAAQGIQFSQQVTRAIEDTLAANNLSFNDVADNQEIIALLEKNTYAALYSYFLIADCSGAFIIFDTTVNTKLPNAKHSRSGMYIKAVNINTSKPVNPKVSLFRGIPEIGYDNDHVFSNKWELEFNTANVPFYRNVIRNASKDLTACYYYSPAFKLPGTLETAMLLCVPLVGKNGKVYGVCGFEISTLFFKLFHAEAGSPAERLTELVAQETGGSVLLETRLESGTRQGYFAGLSDDVMSVSQMGELNRYSVNGGQENGSMREFVGVETAIAFSPLSGKIDSAPWVAISMIPKEDYDRMVKLSYFKFVLFCVVFFSIATMLAHYISRRYSVPILQGINAIKTGSTKKTYIHEIDDLMEFLTVNDTVQEADMSAFYEFKQNVKKLTRAETAVFNLYMEGYSAAKIAEMLYVSINTIKSHNKNIYKKLNITSRQELLLFAQMMKTVDQ